MKEGKKERIQSAPAPARAESKGPPESWQEAADRAFVSSTQSEPLWSKETETNFTPGERAFLRDTYVRDHLRNLILGVAANFERDENGKLRTPLRILPEYHYRDPPFVAMTGGQIGHKRLALAAARGAVNDLRLILRVIPTERDIQELIGPGDLPVPPPRTKPRVQEAFARAKPHIAMRFGRDDFASIFLSGAFLELVRAASEHGGPNFAKRIMRAAGVPHGLDPIVQEHLGAVYGY